MTSMPPAETAEKFLLSAKNRPFVYVCFAKMSERLVFDGEKNDYIEL